MCQDYLHFYDSSSGVRSVKVSSMGRPKSSIFLHTVRRRPAHRRLIFSRFLLQEPEVVKKAEVLLIPRVRTDLHATYRRSIDISCALAMEPCRVYVSRRDDAWPHAEVISLLGSSAPSCASLHRLERLCVALHRADRNINISLQMNHHYSENGTIFVHR